jgi:UDP-N-acetylglucosamine 2-epimerase
MLPLLVNSVGIIALPTHLDLKKILTNSKDNFVIKSTMSTTSTTQKNNLVIVVGNRPQFIKMAPVIEELNRKSLKYTVIHTGQHYDHQMSGIFFKELGIPKPDIQIQLNSRLHGAMTAEILEKLESIFLEIVPKGLLLFGDTNSTLAAGLAAVKLQIPIAHVEAGPRLGNFDTPEESNRLIVDHLSKLRFCCDLPSIKNLEREGIYSGVVNSGDVMFDAFLKYSGKREVTLNKDKKNIYLTLHRPQNVDSREAHLEILSFINECGCNVFFPLHARTKLKIEEFGLTKEYEAIEHLTLSGPLGYVESIAYVNASDFVITDSGGVQKEAYFAGKLCILMLPAGPWPDLINSGWLLLGDWFFCKKMMDTFKQISKTGLPNERPKFFGNGNASVIVVDELIKKGFI